MKKRRQQSAPPSPYDVTFGLPLGPGGIAFLIRPERSQLAAPKQATVPDMAALPRRALRRVVVALRTLLRRSTAQDYGQPTECCP
ncbi:MAG: hypothetical protein ACRBM6_23275 [Geminicoccales bacterium]